MSGDDLIFTLGVAGNFEFAQPLAAKLPQNTRMAVQAVRYIGEMVADGFDLKALYEGIAESVMLEDIAKDRPILKLVTEGGESFLVPQSQVIGYPRIDGVAYRPFNVVLDLGMHPEETDFTALNQALESTVLTFTGVSTTAVSVVMGDGFYVGSDQHQQLTIARSNSKEVIETDAAKVLRLQTKINELQQIKTLLEQEIIRLKS
jgi:hypothetical protein